MSLPRPVLALSLLAAVLLAACGGDGGPAGRPNPRKVPTATPYATLPAPTIISGGATTPATRTGEDTYVVEAGDTLSAIADRLGVPVEDIVRLNNLADPGSLEVGQVLKVPSRAGAGATPQAGTTPRETPRAATTPRPTGEFETYVVQSGDNASDIADRFGVTIEELAEANDTTIADLRSLEVGQELKIPPPSSTPRPVVTEEPTEEPPTPEPVEETPEEQPVETPTPEA